MPTARSYRRLLATLCLIGGFAGGAAHAATAQEKADQLGGEKYTCIGAERAGSDSGIPEFTGKYLGEWPGMEGGPAGYKPGPYADEKPEFTINASNMHEHKERLTAGQMALMEAYPDEFFMNIYPSHRDFANRDWVCDVVKKNAVEAEIIDDGLGVKATSGGVPFPFPETGLEAIWNVIVPHRAWSEQVTYDIANVYDNGSVAWGRMIFRTLNPGNHPEADKRLQHHEEQQNAFFYTEFLRPPRDAGFVALGHQPNNFSSDTTDAWQYQPGLRRVRQAPEVGFDYPVPPAGMRNVDDDYLFNGSPERFTWKLVGKREYYVPYHNFKINDPSLSYDDLVGERTINPEHVRYELHRVWVIEGTLKDGVRHNYGRRVIYVDEDSWLAVWADNYDRRGNLWRPNFVNYFYSPESKSLHRGVTVFHDLTAGTYEASYLVNEREDFWKINREMSQRSFAPEALSRRGR